MEKIEKTGIDYAEMKADPRTRLLAGITALSKAYYEVVLIATPGLKPSVTDSIFKSVPLIDFITDGRIALTWGIESSDDINSDRITNLMEERVKVLPLVQVEDCQSRLEKFLTTASAISFSTSQRLKPYLQVTLPDTREGLRGLKEMAAKVADAIGLKVNPEKLGDQLKDLEDVLRMLESEVLVQMTANKDLAVSVAVLARNEAKVQLFEARRQGDGIQNSLRREIAEREITRLKEIKVKEIIDGEEREFSELDRELYKMIEEKKLAERLPEAREQMRSTVEERKKEVVEGIIRRRVIRKVAGLMLSDPLVIAISAKIGKVTEEQLKTMKDEKGMTFRVKIASQLLDITERKLVRFGFSKFPKFDTIFEDEKNRVQRAIDFGDPFLFAAQLDPKEFDLIRVRIPNVFRRRLSGDNRAIFALAREELRRKLSENATYEEMEELLSDKLFRNLLREFAQETIDRSIQALGLDNQKLLDNPVILFDFTDQVLLLALAKENGSQNIVIPSQETLPTNGVDYEFTVPKITTGKCQLVSPESLLRFGTMLSPLNDLAALAQAIEESEFVPFFEDPVFKYYPPERKLEMIFSIVGRGAGSKLAGSPLFELKDDFRGLITPVEDIEGKNIVIQETYGTRIIKNSIRLSPLVGTVGQPFSRNLPEATKIIAQAIDTVSANLEKEFQRSGRSKIGVEEATDIIRNNLPILIRRTNDSIPGREVLQMDFFLLYPPDVRRRMIETFIADGKLDRIKSELAELTQQGMMRASVFDISGGSGGVGITEFLSKRILDKSSGHMEAYMDAVLFGAYSRLGKMPTNAVITPRQADLTLMNFEYLPTERALRERLAGKVGISTLELLQAAIETDGEKLEIGTLKGEVIRPDTIIKRFTFPNEGKGAGYRGDLFVRMPAGVTMAPLNSSRIVASDKRVNLKIVEMLKDQLIPFGIDPIPYLDLDLRSGNFEALSEQVVEFMVANRNAYPEIDFFGGVVKTGDKIPGREKIAGEVISAYPIPSSVMINPDMRRAFIVKKLRELYLRGVSGVIVQPNILSLVADNEGNIAPKFEVKMMAFAKPRR